MVTQQTPFVNEGYTAKFRFDELFTERFAIARRP